MQVLSAPQLRALDEATVLADGISSTDLMERASAAFVEVFRDRYTRLHPVVICCGPGNNGGDGLAIARLLHEHYRVTVLDARIGERSPDNETNLLRAARMGLSIREVLPGDAFPELPAEAVVVDALFGTGLSRPLTGYWADFATHYGNCGHRVVAVDLPSGLFADRPTTGPVFRADHTISLGLPKMALFAPANTAYLGRWEIAPFALADPATVADFPGADGQGPAFLSDAATLRPRLKKRAANDHKGTFGHVLLLAGRFGSMGAAVIAGRAVLRAGAGLLTCHVPRSGYEIMQISFPEAMCTVDAHRYRTTEVGPLAAYTTVAAGPGLGTEAMTAAAFRDVLERCDRPMVLDADALNLLGREPELLALVPKNSLLTPHPKEFSRLCGETEDDFARWRVQRAFAREHGVYLILKTGYTAVATPTGELHFNPTGNPGMGTAGTGDALTGVLAGLLAQDYAPGDAARLGVYLHGLAGDLAAEALGQEFLLAEDVVSHLGKAFRTLRGSKVGDRV